MLSVTIPVNEQPSCTQCIDPVDPYVDSETTEIIRSQKDKMGVFLSLFQSLPL